MKDTTEVPSSTVEKSNQVSALTCNQVNTFWMCMHILGFLLCGLFAVHMQKKTSSTESSHRVATLENQLKLMKMHGKKVVVLFKTIFNC